jgi:uroporphyrinogen decarboxylase
MLKNTLYLDTIAGKQTNRIPVWFMRQAGRSLPEYKALKGEDSILKVLEDPKRSAEITLQPVKRHDVDAAVLYSDIMVPLKAAGVNLEIQEGLGPVVRDSFTDTDDIKRIDVDIMPDNLKSQIETINLIKSTSEVPLIGFIGAPFTLSCYLLDGRPTKNWTKTQTMILENPYLMKSLFDRLASLVIKSIEVQVKAGVDAIQIFDSWAGIINPRVFTEFLKAPLEQIISFATNKNIPITYFGLKNFSQMSIISKLKPSVVGIDSTMDISQARDVLDSSITIQGNLNPVSCLAEFSSLKGELEEVITQGLKSKRELPATGDKGLSSGYIFNLGHGVLPETDPDTLTGIVKFIHDFKF